MVRILTLEEYNRKYQSYLEYKTKRREDPDPEERRHSFPETSFNDYLEWLKYLEYLYVESTKRNIAAEELQNLPHFREYPFPEGNTLDEVKKHISEEEIEKGSLTLLQRNLRILDNGAWYGLHTCDNYGILLIGEDEKIFENAGKHLRDDPEFRKLFSPVKSFDPDFQSFQPNDTQDYSKLSQLEKDKISYSTSVHIDIRRGIKGHVLDHIDPVYDNMVDLMLHGTAVGNARSALVIADIIKKHKIPAHFGASSKSTLYFSGALYIPQIDK